MGCVRSEGGIDRHHQANAEARLVKDALRAFSPVTRAKPRGIDAPWAERLSELQQLVLVLEQGYLSPGRNNCPWGGYLSDGYMSPGAGRDKCG